jgi:PKD repeat protein
MKLSRIASHSLLALALALAACQSHSPTEPGGGGGTPSTPQPPPTVTTYSITVTANPSQLSVGSSNPSSITVQVRRADNGQPPPDLTQVTLATSLGEFGSVGSGLQTLTLQLVGGQAQAFLFAGTSAGTATVRATLDQSAGVTNVQIGQADAFFVSSITPGVGDPAGGQDVTINGGGFVQPVRVTFNSATAQVRSVSANRIVVTTPSATSAGVSVGVGQSAPVSVTVTINANQTGQRSDTLTNGFTYAFGGTNDQPQAFSITPASGSNDGGTRVTIAGTGFQQPVQVFFGRGTDPTAFNGVEATVESVSSTRIVAITPAARGFGQDNVNQTVDLLIRNLNTGFSTIARQFFRYGTDVLITAVGPTRVPFDSPTNVTIQGQGFESPVAVSLAGFAAQVLSVSGTEIVVRSPVVQVSNCTDVSGPVSVVNINTGNGASALTFTFTAPHPLITGVSPTSGTQSGGTTVTITGSGFEAPLRVLFGGQAATVLSSTATQIVVQTPQFTGTLPTLPCDDNHDGVQGTRDQPLSVDVQVFNLNTNCTNVFPRGFTFTPADASCHNDSAPVAAPTASFTFFVLNPATHTVQFTDTSTGAPTSWQWDFTNNGSFDSAVQNPQFSFPAAGTYATLLRVSNAAGSSQVVMQVTVP